LGVPADVLDPAGLAVLDPGATMDVAGGVHYPLDCHLSPARFMAHLQARLEAAGATFRWRTDVAGWQTEDGPAGRGRVAAARTTAGDEIEADAFVLAAGSWSAAAGRSLKLRIPLQAGKGYSLTLAEPRQRPQLCSILTEARVAVTPMGEAVRFGGTMEVAGLDESISRRRVRGIVRSVPDYYPAFREADFDGVPPWQGLRPVSPDGLPYLGRTGRWANLVVATGHAMMGLSLGPATGKLVARLVSGEGAEAELPGQDLSILSPDRYA
ncbi:MAG: dadA, partial [Phycisphaerales bacterium]|nr:dadA [Phycisphaerales bacterium]